MPLELVDEPALADAGDADEREELRRPLVARALEGVADDAELALAADELRARLVRDVDAEARVRCDRLPDGDRLGLALRLDGLGAVVVDRADASPGRWSRPTMTPLTGAALCRRAAVLTTSPDAMPSPASGRASRRDERLSGRDPDPKLEPLLEREVADRERRAHGALGVVLVGRRRAEERHDRVADELLDRAAVSLELGADALVIRAGGALRRPRDPSTRRVT